jgi:hypothetical protein
MATSIPSQAADSQADKTVSDVATAAELEARALHQLDVRDQRRRDCPPAKIEIYGVEVYCELLPAEWVVEEGSGTEGKRIRQVVKIDSAECLPKPFNPWTIQQDFLMVKPGDLKGLLSFLNKYGQWSEDAPSDPQEYWDFQTDMKEILLSNSGYYREFLRDKVDRLFKKSYAASFPWQAREQDRWRGRRPGKKRAVPRVQFNICFCGDALRLTTDIDFHRGSPFKPCPREGCSNIFRARPNKKYCGNRCAHAASERRTAPKRQKLKRAKERAATRNS